MKTYGLPVFIEQDEDGVFVASVPALRGCHTQARSMATLLRRIREAAELCLQVQGKPSPNTFVGVHQLELSR